MLTDLLTFGIVTTGVAATIRALPWPDGMKARKPLSCVLCMAVWGALFVMLFASIIGYWHLPPTWRGFLFHWLGTVGVATPLLAHTGLFTTFSIGD